MAAWSTLDSSPHHCHTRSYLAFAQAHPHPPGVLFLLSSSRPLTNSTFQALLTGQRYFLPSSPESANCSDSLAPYICHLDRLYDTIFLLTSCNCFPCQTRTLRLGFHTPSVNDRWLDSTSGGLN